MNRQKSTISNTNTIVGNGNVFIHETAEVEACILDTSSGPIYFGENSKALPGCMIKGPVAVCNGAVLKMGAKIYGGTTIGPKCKVGGEVSNVVFHSNSNKGHDGYLGNAVVG